jgi:hypothetical protein
VFLEESSSSRYKRARLGRGAGGQSKGQQRGAGRGGKGGQDGQSARGGLSGAANSAAGAAGRLRVPEKIYL